MSNKTFYKSNYLPHWQPTGGIFFVTFRLYGSIPKTYDEKLREERNENIAYFEETKPKGYKELIENEKRKYFKKFDHALEKMMFGPHYFKEDDIAQIVINKIKEFDDTLYNLMAYSIMSNHVHIVIDTRVQVYGLDLEKSKFVPLNKIMKLLKGATSRLANQILNRSGQPFWHRDYRDTLVKSDQELLNVISYTIENPVNAGLVSKWEDWPYSYWADVKDDHPDSRL